MKYDPGLKIGDQLTFQELRTIFQCGNTGGMLQTNKFKTLVLISDHTKGLYDDQWRGPVLYYTGMGQEGDQVLKGNANRTLAESNTNGYTVHLFEVYVEKQYIYRGIVELIGEPYQTDQLDKNNNMRKVWVFPVQLEQDLMDIELETDENLLEAVENLPDEELDNIDFAYRPVPVEKGVSVTRNNITVYPRKPKISANALAYARYLCEVDEKHPTFIRRKNNRSYTEPHHLVPMKYSKDFPVSLDVEANIVSLCSNCHNEIHYGKYYERLLEILYERRKDLLAQAGIYITLERLKGMYPINN